MRIVKDKVEVKYLHRKLMLQLKKFESEKILALSGHKGHGYTKEVSYSSELDIWWDLGSIVEGQADQPRYWNAFGIGKPIPDKVANIICEINYPVEGINKRVAANWVVDGNDVLLVHSGKIGGGRAGIGKTAFIEHYSGIFEETDIEDLPQEITVIGKLDDKSLAYQIKNFIYEVARIKDLIVNKKTPKLVNKALHSFNEEFVGIKEYKNKREKISATVNHGLIVKTLKDILAARKKMVANDQQRDLYIYSTDARIRTVFEIKTSLSSQTIFTAVGQLYVNNIRIKPLPKLIYVIPEKPNKNLMKTLAELKIDVLIYSWKEGKPQFKKIDNLLLNA